MKINRNVLQKEARYIANEFKINETKNKITAKLFGETIDIEREKYLIAYSKNKVSVNKILDFLVQFFENIPPADCSCNNNDYAHKPRLSTIHMRRHYYD